MFIYKKLTLAIMALSVITTIYATGRVIVEPTDGPGPIVDLINRVNYSIELSVYQFYDEDGASQPILDALASAERRGIDVEIITNHFLKDSWPPGSGKYYKEEAAWAKANDITFIPSSIGNTGFTFMHNKYMVIDAGLPSEKALIMTGNLGGKSFITPRNFYVIDYEPKDISYLKSLFKYDTWNSQINATITPFPTLAPDVLVAPYEDCASKIESFCKGAQQTLDIYMMYFADTCPQGIFDGIAKALVKGVNVRIIISCVDDPAKQTAVLEKQFGNPYPPNLQVLFEPNNVNPFIHTKTFIKDGSSALLGSINMSSTSFTNNREVDFITSDTNIVNTIQNTFNSDWQYFQ